MRFQKLSIRNFRGIREFVIDGLGDSVVVAGPNGCGKTCVLDAMRLLKSVYGGYQENEWQMWFGEFQINLGRLDDMKRLFRDPNKPVEITAEFELAKSELEYLQVNAETVLTPIVWREILGRDIYAMGNTALFASELRQYGTRVKETVTEGAARLRVEMEKGSFTGGMVISETGQVEATESKVLELVFQTYDPHHIGVIDYHSSSRNYEREAIGGVNLNLDAVTAQRRQYSLYNLRDKYRNVKAELATHFVRDMIASRGGVEAISSDLNATLEALFKTFFPDKSYRGPVAHSDGTVTFPVYLSSGLMHDIDELSSGEKELLYGYLRLRDSAPKNSIILLDEPELHLNPRLLQGMADFYHKYLGQALGNQLWLVTHSDALLRQAVGNPNFSVFHMMTDRGETEGNQALVVSAVDELDRAIVDIVGDLAAYRPRAKVVIFEGERDTEIDVTIVSRLFPDFAQQANLVSGGPKRRVRDLYSILAGAAQQARLPERFYAITDRDQDLSELTRETRVFRWDRYHIENYLLEPDLILEAVESLKGTQKTLTSAQVYDQLRVAATSLVSRLVLERLQAEVNTQLVGAIRIGADRGTTQPAVDLRSSIDGSRGRLDEVFKRFTTSNWLSELEDEIRATLTDALRNSSWIAEFPGRSVLSAYVQSNVGGVSYEAFRNVVIGKMVDAKFQPNGMAAILDQIVRADD